MRTWFAICLILLTLGCAQESGERPGVPLPSGGESRLVDRGGGVVEGDFEVIKSRFEPGSEVRLTLDGALQRALEAELSPLGSRGAAVVLDARSGAVLAMRGGLEAHPSGSIFKPVSMLAGLEAGVVDPERDIDCQGHIDIGQRRHHCFKSEGHGPLDMKAALATSCNVFAYTVGEEVGIEPVVKMGRRLGLSMATGIELEEAVGDVGASAQRVPGMAASVATGHGPVRVTPLQMARAYAAVATGKLARVHLVEEAVGPGGEVVTPEREAPEALGIDEGHLEVVRRGLRAAVGSDLGTARGIELSGLQIAGKTGTIQPERGVEGPDHAWFVGYAPADDPKVVVAVFVAHGGYGSRAAAPVAQRLIKAAIE